MSKFCHIEVRACLPAGDIDRGDQGEQSSRELVTLEFQTFLVYILSHNRPAHEVLQPRLKDIQRSFEQEFLGMTTEKTSLDALLATREQLIAAIHSRLDEAAKNFLLSFHHLKPTWELLNLPGIENLPAVRWKLANLEIMQNKQPEKYQTMMRDLESVLAKKESAPHE